MKHLLPILMIAAFPSLCSAQQYAWQEPQATVTETGAIRWSPKPFVDKLEGREVRYIDFDGGDDNADGKTPQAAWKHHPWDHYATGNAAEASGPMTYVFKRGVFYRNPLKARESGEPGRSIRLTSTADWGEGEAVMAGSIRLPGEWVRADRVDFDTPEHLPEKQKVWALDLTKYPWWNSARPGYNAHLVGEANFEQNRRPLEAPSIGLFSLGADGGSEWHHLARDPDWQPPGTEFAYDFWHSWDGNGEPFKDESGEVAFGPTGPFKGPAHADRLRGKPQDFFDGAVVWSTWPSLQGSATPKGPLKPTTTQKQTKKTVDTYDPETGRLAILQQWGYRSGTRFMIENVPGYLDAPGEYYLHQDGRDRAVLYFRPEEGRSPNDMQLELAVNHGALHIARQANIEVSGLGFRFIHGPAVLLEGESRDIRISHCRFEHLLRHAVHIDLMPDQKTWVERMKKDPADWKAQWMDNIFVTDNYCQHIWDEALSLRAPIPRMSWPAGRIGHIEVLRNALEDVGFRHSGGPWAAVPAIVVNRFETGMIAGNIVKRALGSGIMISGSNTQGLKGSDWPLVRGLVYHNATEDTALGVNDYGGFSLWQGGPLFIYNNNVGNSTGYMPSGLWQSPRPRTLAYPYYIDGGYKIHGFNNIVWDRSTDPDDPYRSETAGYFSVFGFLNHFTNNTLYRHARATGGSSGNRTDLVSNVFAEISDEFIRNNRVENPSLVGGGDSGASGIMGLSSLAYGKNIFHGQATGGSLFKKDPRNDTGVEQEIAADTIAELAERMQAFPLRWGQLGAKVEKEPVIGELSSGGLTDQGAEAADFRLTKHSEAIDAGATYFTPWPLAATVGEWNFTENHADPAIVVDYALYMSEIHFNRFMYSFVPILSLQVSEASLDDYVPAPSEDWVNGALAFDGNRSASVRDGEMRADAEVVITSFITGRGQQGWDKYDQWVERGTWKFPEPEDGFTADGQPKFGPTQTAKYPAERRNTLISNTRNLLIEAKFRTEPDHTGGYLANKQDGENGYALRVDPQGRAAFTILAGGRAHTVATEQPVNDGQWRHVLAEIDRQTGRMTLYLDGKQAAEQRASLDAQTSIDSEADFVVGRSSAAEQDYFQGAIDFLRVCHGTLADAKTSIGELYAWQYTDGPHLFDMLGQKPMGARRDAGAIERQ